ncbi:pyruvate formate-lyase 1-activating enzyme [Clostridium thermosuccinogenes]|uniref:Pyruvate formate-lyase-activating enzyme n=1 Tax=Clostridium thermosuccinogenes TaxID=84032 RepID=A0A2K2F8T8_9CLOT|nr:pyruvate formate-lyase-activating protein [Pseudoclostridium thermosuccinogenes]AUS97484.1 pyruvate formate-lyase 1-activating enzyme [Pseudoclostridium thermosuccinogenes]PNT94683.1 pyruvate formate-lyase 1-activating enzyme [Pseudoclostridium thermosuccinogenes]PNT95178.1 pyruvate formate-lyase 1-activating enzyme [Pseudoclostridium thermosuccinogenes]
MAIKGRIHSFESFGTVDGPGIRFVVFMQGCPLRCIYCHNRDTWDVSGGREYTVDEVMEQVKKYLTYMRSSGGGITVTGGEPTLQAGFVAELFKRCREMDIHTALDTSGFAAVEKVKELLEYTDLILLDIKHAVDEKHKEITGVSNELIKKFALYASEKGIPIWIRHVLVPGYTDSEEDLRLAGEFIKQLKTVEKVEVLPYHNMGEYKWEKLGQEYKLKGVRSPTAEEVNRAVKILEGKQ